MDSFNIPYYAPCPGEVKAEVLKEGPFIIDQLEFTEVNWNAYHNEVDVSNVAFKDCGYNVAKGIRAVLEPLLASHFGVAIIDELFQRYGEIVANQISKKEKTVFVNLTVSLVKG